jgi:hypothetical protein
MDDSSGLFSGVFLIFYFAWFILLLVAGWQMYVKAGQKGWVAIIPFVNLFGLLKIVHRPWWWFLLLLIPIVNFFVWIALMLDLAKAFGKGVGMALVLIFLTGIGYLVLGFGGATYELEEDPLF